MLKKRGGGAVSIVSSEKLFSPMMALIFMGTRETQTEHSVAIGDFKGVGEARGCSGVTFSGNDNARIVRTLTSIIVFQLLGKADGSDIIRFVLKVKPRVKEVVFQKLKFRDPVDVPFSSHS